MCFKLHIVLTVANHVISLDRCFSIFILTQKMNEKMADNLIPFRHSQNIQLLMKVQLPLEVQ